MLDMQARANGLYTSILFSRSKNRFVPTNHLKREACFEGAGGIGILYIGNYSNAIAQVVGSYRVSELKDAVRHSRKIGGKIYLVGHPVEPLKSKKMDGIYASHIYIFKPYEGYEKIGYSPGEL